MRNGVLHGSLYLVGGGDPALGTPSFYGASSAGWAPTSSAQAPGPRSRHRVVTGRLYADDSVFDRLRGVADSGYATSSEIGPLSGLSFNSGYSSASGRQLRDRPGQDRGRARLRGALREAGVRISTTVALAPRRRTAPRLARVESPPLEQLVNTTDVYSNNFFAEMLIKLIGARFGGAGSTAGGRRRWSRASPAITSPACTRSTAPGSPAPTAPRRPPGRRPAAVDARRRTSATNSSRTSPSPATRARSPTACTAPPPTVAAAPRPAPDRAVSNLSGYCFNRSGQVMIFSILMAQRPRPRPRPPGAGPDRRRSRLLLSGLAARRFAARSSSDRADANADEHPEQRDGLHRGFARVPEDRRHRH